MRCLVTAGGEISAHGVLMLGTLWGDSRLLHVAQWQVFAEAASDLGRRRITWRVAVNSAHHRNWNPALKCLTEGLWSFLDS